MTDLFDWATPEMVKAFDKFDRENPDVFAAFERLALTAIKKGKTRLSSKLICEVIRWEVFLETSGEEFKINNNYTAFYARKFMDRHPEHGKCFETRRSKADRKFTNNPQSPVTYPGSPTSLSAALGGQVVNVDNTPNHAQGSNFNEFGESGGS